MFTKSTKPRLHFLTQRTFTESKNSTHANDDNSEDEPINKHMDSLLATPHAYNDNH